MDPHARIQALFPTYASGELDAARAGEVRTHLATCETCRQAYSPYVECLRSGSGNSEHPPAERLFGFPVPPAETTAFLAEMPSGTRLWTDLAVTRHLADCPTCREARELGLELRARATAGSRPALARRWSGLGALAAVILVGFIALQQLRPAERPSLETAPPAGESAETPVPAPAPSAPAPAPVSKPSPTPPGPSGDGGASALSFPARATLGLASTSGHPLAGAMRSAGNEARNRIALPAGAHSVILAVEPFLDLPEDARIRVALVDSTGRGLASAVIRQRDLVPARGGGNVEWRMPGGMIPRGRFSLLLRVLAPAGPSGVPPDEARYDFTIVTGPERP